MNYISLLLLPILGHIIYTDIREYKISLLAVILAGIVTTIRFFNLLNQEMLVETLVLNTLFILILLSVLYIYCHLRKIAFFNAFGLGDILFFVVALLSFAPFSFVLYVILSSLLGIVYFVALRILNKNIQQIPYAGIMAALLLVLLLLDIATSYTTYSDNWIFQF